MKIFILSLFLSFSLFAGPAEDLMNQLNSEQKELFNAALLEQRNALVKVHEEQLTKVTGDIKNRETKAEEIKEKAKVDVEKVKTDAELKINTIHKTISDMKAAEEKTGKGKRWEVLDLLQGEFNKTPKDLMVKSIEERLESLKKELEEAKK